MGKGGKSDNADESDDADDGKSDNTDESDDADDGKDGKKKKDKTKGKKKGGKSGKGQKDKPAPVILPPPGGVDPLNAKASCKRIAAMGAPPSKASKDSTCSNILGLDSSEATWEAAANTLVK